MNNQNKLISATNAGKPASLAKFDKGWADLNHQSDDFICINPFAPKPIKAKRSLVGRIFRAAWLWATTKYRLSTAWAVAGV